MTHHIDCPRLDNCQMFRVFDSAGFAEAWKTAYCVGKFPQCRRYRLFLHGEAVPPNLLPNGEDFPMPKDLPHRGKGAPPREG